MSDADTSVINPDQPYRMPDQGAVDAWRAGTPASPLAPQSPLSALGPPPAPTPPPQYPKLNVPPMPAPPTQQQLGPAPDAKEYQQDSMAFASAMAVLGAVASKFTRVTGTQALSAFAGALNGWKQGNLQAYEQAAKKWEQDTKATLENNRQIMEQYKLALENRKMNIDEQMSQIQLVSAQYHDKMMYDAAASKNYTLVAQIYEKNVEYTQKAQDAAAKLQEKRDEQRQKNEQSATYWLSPEGQAKLPTLSPSQQAGVKQLIDIYGSKSAKGGQTGQLVSQENSERQARGELPMTAQEEISFIQGIHPPRSAPAMAVEAFKKDFEAKNGRPPNGDEITKFAANYSGEQSYGRTAGSQGARVENASNEVEQLIPQAVEASRNYARQGGKYVGLNKLFQAYDQGTSDPKYNDFVLANFSLINAYARAMNPQGVPRITERLEAHATGILSTATDERAYEVQVRRLWKEVQASKTATAKTAEGRSPGDINAPVPGMDAPAVPASGAVVDPAKMSDDELRKKLGL
jgi:hypothetical protein